MLPRRLCSLFALLLCLSAATSAIAQESPDAANNDKVVVGKLVKGWEATFQAKAVNSYVEKGGLK